MRDASISVSPFQYEPIVNRHSRTPSGVFNSSVMFLADQLDRNVILGARTRPTIVTSVVNLSNLATTSDLGRMISEHLAHELQLRYWTVSDIRMNREVMINESGEFGISRDVKRLQGNMTAANVVTGTYSSTPDGVLVNIRVIDKTTGQVVSTAQTRFMKDKFLSGIVDPPPSYPVVKLSN
jgi:TolB-like protein